MWNENLLVVVVLLALVYVGVVVLPGAPKLIDALSDRIRHGVQPVGDDLDDEDAEEAAAAPVAAKPARPATASTKARATA